MACMLITVLSICLLRSIYSYENVTYCFDDVCVETGKDVAHVWFTDTEKVMVCPEPYASCDVGKLVYDFCFDTFGYTGSNRSVCANNLWRMHAIKVLERKLR